MTRQDLVRLLQDQQLQLTAHLEKNLYKWQTNQQEMITEFLGSQETDIVPRKDMIGMLQEQQTQFLDRLTAKLDSWQASSKEMIFSQIGQSSQSQSYQQVEEHDKLVLEVRAQVQSGILKSQQMTEKFINEELNPLADLAKADREVLRQMLSGNRDQLEQHVTQEMRTLANIEEFLNKICQKVDRVGGTRSQSMESLAVAITTMSESVTRTQEKMMNRWERFEHEIHQSIATMQARHHHDMDSISNRLEQSLQRYEDIQQNITQMGRNLERIMYDYTRPYQAAGMDGGFQPHGLLQAEPNNQGADASQFRETPSRRSNKNKESSYNSRKKSKATSRKYDTVDPESSSSSSSSESDSDMDDSDDSSRTAGLPRPGSRNHRSLKAKHRGLKSNPFDGSEKWKVWYKRFKVGTKGWKTAEKLDAMLQLMKGKAADFVFDQLPDETLQNYGALKAELKNRYRKVENPETYAVMFANRCQQAAETVQDFAAELTMLYDKAHPGRDAKTRREDLRRRWLDGVRDKKAAKQVEFVKNPRTMEDAIDAFIKLQGLNSHTGSNKASKVSNFYESDYDSDNDQPQDVRLIKSNNRGNPVQTVQSQTKSQAFGNQRKQGGNYNNSNLQGQQYSRPNQNSSQQGYQQQGQQYNQQNFGQQSQQPFGSPRRYSSYQQGNQNMQSRSGYNQQNSPQPRSDFNCFKCGGLNHMAKNCPTQVASQPRYSSQPTVPTSGLSLFGGQIRQQPAGFGTFSTYVNDPSQVQPSASSQMSMFQMAPPPLSPSYQTQNFSGWDATAPKVVDDRSLPSQNTQQVISAPTSSQPQGNLQGPAQ